MGYEVADTKCRVSALSGLLGALIMLAGDFLLYAHWGKWENVTPAVEALLAGRKAILEAEPEHLLLSALTGPLAAVFYLGGVWHVFVRLRSHGLRLACVVAALFAFVQVTSGAYHAMWAQYAVIVQYANANPEAQSLLDGGARTMQFVLDVQTWCVLPLMIMLLVQVARGKTDYPRWTLALNPFLLYGVLVAVLTPVAAKLAVPYGGLLLGGLYNALMVVFFAMSLCAVPGRTVGAGR